MVTFFYLGFLVTVNRLTFRDVHSGTCRDNVDYILSTGQGKYILKSIDILYSWVTVWAFQDLSYI